MKRLLSGILIVLILISNIVTFADDNNVEIVAESDARKISILTALGFLDSFSEEGLLSPNEPVSRAELVSLAMALINSEKYPDSGKLWFNDVFADNKHFDEISTAASLGVISGYSDGNFRPDDSISYDGAVSVIVKSLGYQVMAELNGGWTIGYHTVAGEIGLTDGFTVANYDALSRIEALRLVYRALQSPVLRERAYGDFVEYEADTSCTVLSEYHDIYKADGYVNATYVSALAGYSVTNNKHIQIGDVIYAVDNNEYAEYLGYYVDVYYKDNGESKKEIVYIIPDEKLEQLLIKADDIADFENLTYHYGSKKRAEISAKHTLIVNGKRMTEYDESTFVPHNGEVILLSYNGVKYNTVIINTFHSFTVQRAQKGAYTTATFTAKYGNYSFGIDMSREDLRFDLYVDGQKFEFREFTYQTNTDNFFDDQDYTDTPVTIHTTYTFPIIPEGAVASVFADKYTLKGDFYAPAEDAKFIKIYITTSCVEGVAGKKSDDYLTIEDKEYEIAYENTLDKESEAFRLGKYGKFVFDYDGKIAAWLPDIYSEDEYVYGYLIKAAKKGGPLSNNVVAKVLKKDGKIEIFEFEQKVRINSKQMKDSDEILRLLGESAKMLDPTFTISQLIKYKLSDGRKIKDIQTVLQSVGLPEGADSQHLNRDMERAELSHSENMFHIRGNTEKYPNAARLYSPNIYAIHFVVPSIETFDDVDYWIQDSWRVNFSRQDWLYDGWKDVDVFDCNDFKAPNAVVIYEDYEGIIKDREDPTKPEDKERYPVNWDFIQNYVLVNEITEEISPSGTIIYVLNAYDGWGPVSYYSYDANMFNEIKQGDFVRLRGNRELLLRKPEVIMGIDEVRNCDLNTVPDNLDSAVFEVYSKKTSSKHMVLQRGPLLDDGSGKRTLQLANYFRGGGGPVSGFTSGPLFYGEGETPVFSYFYSGIRDSFSDIKPVLDVGTENATRVYVMLKSGMKAIIIYDLEE